jgi:hypothetical protein
MASPYVKQCLKDIDKDLKKLSKQDRLRYLHHYNYGLELGLHGNYSNEFPLPSGEVQITDSLSHQAYWKAYDISNQFGPLEAGLAKELLAEIGSRKDKFSKPGVLSRINEFLTSYYQSFGRGVPRLPIYERKYDKSDSKPRYFKRIFWDELRRMRK